MQVTGIALEGIQRAESKLEQTAQRLAGLGSSPDALAPDPVDLSVEAVALLESRVAFSASVRMIQTVDQLQREALNLLA